MSKLIINAGRQGYGTDQINYTMTVGDLIAVLQDYDEETPIYIGNDRQSYGWYTYGGITYNDIEEICDDAEENADEY